MKVLLFPELIYIDLRCKLPREVKYNLLLKID